MNRSIFNVELKDGYGTVIFCFAQQEEESQAKDLWL
jgi:hypothetical protein